MSKAQLIITDVVLARRSNSEVAGDYESPWKMWWWHDMTRAVFLPPPPLQFF
jgi:hypothetical protein